MSCPVDASKMAVREWEKHVDDATQTVYYYNTRTGESSWETPEGFDGDASENAEPTVERLPARWRRFVDESSGKPYYYDEANDVTQWDEPEGADIIESDEEEVESEHEERAPAEEGVVDEAHQSTDNARDSAIPSNNDNDTKKEMQASANETGKSSSKWVRYIDAASGKPYFHDAVSGKTQWEQPDQFVDGQTRPAVSAEYLEHLHRTRAQQMARVSQQVVDPEGHLFRLNAVLDKIGGAAEVSAASAPATSDAEDDGDAPTAAASSTKRPEWQQHVDPHSQRYYYHNIVTGATQWQRPDGPIVSALADWIPPEAPADDDSGERRHQPTVSGVNYVATAKFNRLTGKYEQLGGDEYWQSMGVASDREGRQMGHFFDMSQLEKNREDAKRIKEALKRKNIDWKKVAAEKKARKQKKQNEWLFQD